jgi:hypothetical protein
MNCKGVAKTVAASCGRVAMVVGAPTAYLIGAAAVGVLLFVAAVAGPMPPKSATL